VFFFVFCNLEVLAPQRPPAPPTEYFQFNLGGYDSDNLIAGNSSPHLEGYVGCVRGLKIGDHLFDLSLQVANSSERGMPVTCSVSCEMLLYTLTYCMHTRLQVLRSFAQSCSNNEGII
jgi:hypothetical protein